MIHVESLVWLSGCGVKSVGPPLASALVSCNENFFCISYCSFNHQSILNSDYASKYESIDILLVLIRKSHTLPHLELVREIKANKPI